MAGRYDELVTAIATGTKAELVIVMVIGGERGTGFSIASKRSDAKTILPNLLRWLANTLETS